MDLLNFTPFCDSMKEHFDNVENGKSYIIIRNGKPIAKITPFKEPDQDWKREIKRITLKSGKDSSFYLGQIRDEE